MHTVSLQDIAARVVDISFDRYSGNILKPLEESFFLSPIFEFFFEDLLVFCFEGFSADCLVSFLAKVSDFF